jgi:uncharacterized membrane protein YgaE (UPF0421/DUF939 family)
VNDKLQEIEKTLEYPNYTEHNGNEEVFYMVSHNDFTFLIDQVKRYEADKKTMSQIVGEETLWQSGQYESEMSRLQKKVERYEKALEFYADEDNYFKRVIPPVIESNVVTDKGKVARKALKELTND